MVDADFLSLMPDNSLLVNISRGGVADTGARGEDPSQVADARPIQIAGYSALVGRG